MSSSSSPSLEIKKDKESVGVLFDWPPLESNPQVFTEYLHVIGLSPNYEIGEVFGFDEELLAFIPQPIYGIIVALERLPKKKKTKEEKINNDNSVITESNSSSSNTKNVKFFMRQSGTLDNACGIIACLHAILNNDNNNADGDVDNNCRLIRPDSVLHKFQSRTESQTPAQRCVALEQDIEFQTYHKKFASKGQSQTILSKQDDVKHHFVAFVVHDGLLLELDGTKNTPNVIGECQDVLRGTIAEVQRRLLAKEVTESLSMMTLQINTQN